MITQIFMVAEKKKYFTEKKIPKLNFKKFTVINPADFLFSIPWRMTLKR